MRHIKGMPVTLYEKTKTGTDEFNAPVYSEVPVVVDDVIVSPTAASDITDNLTLY